MMVKIVVVVIGVDVGLEEEEKMIVNKRMVEKW